jgi:orotate phosphoribosyltransferase
VEVITGVMENVDSEYKLEFIQFLLQIDVLKFGEFVLKSGRKSPYFFNMGNVNTGSALATLGSYYSRAIHENFGRVDNIFGPAYKGIPLAVATAFGFELEFGENVGFCFDRKKEKLHGDKGRIVGSIPKSGDKIVIVDDVMTTGGTKYEAVELLRSIKGIDIKGLVIGLNRKEVGSDGVDAVSDFTRKTGIDIFSIADVNDVLEFIKAKKFKTELIQSMEDYISKYSVKK